ncbi:MAG: class I SAM-dependent methyltransferase [Deltaproteobacteria bacterium]
MVTDDREPHPNPLMRLLEPTWRVERPLDDTLAALALDAKICDIGAGGRRIRPDAVCVDVAPGPNVDLVGDAHALPLDDAAYDLAVCTGTLNLCHDPAKVVSEFNRVLRTGGLVHLEVGMFQPYNPEPEDYWRFTLAGLRLLFDRGGFDQVRAGTHIGPMSALATSAMYLSGRLLEGEGLARKAARGASHAVFGPLKYLDGLIPKDKLARTPFGYGIYFVGKKRAS